MQRRQAARSFHLARFRRVGRGGSAVRFCHGGEVCSHLGLAGEQPIMYGVPRNLLAAEQTERGTRGAFRGEESGSSVQHSQHRRNDYECRNHGASIVLAVAWSSSLCLAVGTPWLDAVVSFDRPSGSSNAGGPPGDALGPRNYTFVSIDVPETLVLAFTDNSAGNGPGANLAIRELYNCPAIIDVYASEDNVTYVHLGTISRTVEFDLADYPTLEYVNYLKFVGLDDDGNHPGYDLDAAEALHPVAHIRPDSGTPVPGESSSPLSAPASSAGCGDTEYPENLAGLSSTEPTGVRFERRVQSSRGLTNVARTMSFRKCSGAEDRLSVSGSRAHQASRSGRDTRTVALQYKTPP